MREPLMENVMKAIFCLFWFVVAMLCGCSESSKQGTASGKEMETRALQIMASMRDGSWDGGRSLPELTWSDIDALLTRANSEVLLKSFPANPLSSQAQFSCPEGMMALWLIESIRKNDPGGYPSLNPLCFKANRDKNVPWEEHSRSNLKAAARAYDLWWRNVKDKSPKERSKIDPLQDADLYWY